MPDVVVVGAGMAGVTAARDCVRAGLPVVVVEAQTRVGGRLHTAPDFCAHPLARDARVIDLERGCDWRLAAGYDALPQHLAKDLDVRLGFEVTGVRWGADGVTVTAAGGETISARAGVCTLPVGVLKAHTVRFDPE